MRSGAVRPPDRIRTTPGIVQGFSTPPLMLLMMRMTNRKEVMGDKTNTLLVNVFGWITTVVMFAATGALIYTWVRR